MNFLDFSTLKTVLTYVVGYQHCETVVPIVCTRCCYGCNSRQKLKFEYGTGTRTFPIHGSLMYSIFLLSYALYFFEMFEGRHRYISCMYVGTMRYRIEIF